MYSKIYFNSWLYLFIKKCNKNQWNFKAYFEWSETNIFETKYLEKG